MARKKLEPGELSTLALINLVIPEHSSDFRSGLSKAQQYSDLDPQNNYDKVKHWRLRTLKNLKKYLIDNNFKQPISDESITFYSICFVLIFMYYCLTVKIAVYSDISIFNVTHI